MKRATMWGLAAATATLGVMAARTALAQSGAAAPQPAPEENLYSYILAGGPIALVILFCSIAGLAIAIESFVSLKREKLCPTDLALDLEALADAGRLDEAAAACESRRCYLTNAVSAALARAGEGGDAMQEGLQTGLDREHTKALHRISYLSLIGGLGPMLGLTGTVTGMIASFAKFKEMPNPLPADLAAGINQALVTTAMGLILAIPILTVFFILRNRVQLLAMDTAEVAEGIVERMKTD
jgi:biopolymer transport protein ExbB